MQKPYQVKQFDGLEGWRVVTAGGVQIFKRGYEQHVAEDIADALNEAFDQGQDYYRRTLRDMLGCR